MPGRAAASPCTQSIRRPAAVSGSFCISPVGEVAVGLHRWNISGNRIKRDSFASAAELELAIDLYGAHHNADAEPFIWTASALDILAKVTRARAALLGRPDKYTKVHN